MNYENLEAYELHPEVAHEFSNEMHETELAQELLSVQNEGELNHFLGGLVSGALRGARALYNSSAGQAIKGQLISGAKSIGRQALPQLAGAVGNYFGGNTGGQWGNRFGNWAANRYLNEYENEAPNANNLDTARRLVRMVRQSAIQIASMAQAGQPLTRASVRGVMYQNASQAFPGIRLPQARPSGFTGATGAAPMNTITSATSMAPNSNSGTWYRQGNQLVLSGV